MLIINPDTYRTFIRPLLFRLPPEAAQSVAHLALKQRQVWRAASPLLQVENSRLEVGMAGMRLSNPVGLAAGYDKDFESIPALSSLGFGYLTCGTVTELPRTGNPAPRVLRYESDEALVNSLGFPSKGVEHAAAQLEQAQSREWRRAGCRQRFWRRCGRNSALPSTLGAACVRG